MNFPSSRPRPSGRVAGAARRSAALLLCAGVASTALVSAASAGTAVHAQSATTVRRAGPATPTAKVTTTTKAATKTTTKSSTATTKKSTATTKKSTVTTKKSTVTTKKSTTATTKEPSTTLLAGSGGAISGNPDLSSVGGTPTTVAATATTIGSTVPATTVPATPGAPTAARTPTVFIPGAGRVLDLNATEVGKLAAGGRVEADVRGASGLAASGTGWVILDVTTVTPTKAGKVTLSPSVTDPAKPASASAVAFVPGATARVRAAVAVGVNGSVRVDTQAGPAGLAVDVVGWVVPTPTATTEAAATKLDACTMLDTSAGTGGLTGRVTPTQPFDLPAVGVYSVPAGTGTTAPTAVLFQVTATQASEPLTVTVVPTGRDLPSLVMTVVPGPGATGLFAVPVGGADTRTAFYVSSGGVMLAVDMLGWLDRDSVGKAAAPCS